MTTVHLIVCVTWSLLQAVPTARGQSLADEYGIKFFETVSFNRLLVNKLSLLRCHCEP